MNGNKDSARVTLVLQAAGRLGLRLAYFKVEDPSATLRVSFRRRAMGGLLSVKLWAAQRAVAALRYSDENRSLISGGFFVGLKSLRFSRQLLF